MLLHCQGMLNLVSNCIDRLNVYNSAAHFGECAGHEAGAAWKDILNLLYELLGKTLGPVSSQSRLSRCFYSQQRAQSRLPESASLCLAQN